MSDSQAPSRVLGPENSVEQLMRYAIYQLSYALR